MSEIETVEAWLSIEMYVTCPNQDCENLIDLFDPKDTNGEEHNVDGYLLLQMFPANGDHSDLEADDVTCTQCKTTFNVRELVW